MSSTASTVNTLSGKKPPLNNIGKRKKVNAVKKNAAKDKPFEFKRTSISNIGAKKDTRKKSLDINKMYL
jgi:hypothetical protein